MPRSRVRRELERAGVAIVGDTTDADAAYPLFEREQPTIVLVQIASPGSNAIEVMRGLLAQRRDARIVFYSMHEHPVFAARALHAGVFGYVTGASLPAVLIEAIHSAAAGRKFGGPDIAQKLPCMIMP